MFLAGLSMGADGAIGSTYNFMADKFVQIQSLFRAGDMTAAQALQKEANRIITEYKTGRKRKKRLPFSPLSFFLGMLAASVLAGILLLIFSVVF